MNTFSSLSATLRSLGFQSSKRNGSVVFTHSTGRPVILLPEYKSGQAVSPIHLLMVRKQLTDVGLLKPGPFALKRPSEPASSSKP
jgi:hypothetical protein